MVSLCPLKVWSQSEQESCASPGLRPEITGFWHCWWDHSGSPHETSRGSGFNPRRGVRGARAARGSGWIRVFSFHGFSIEEMLSSSEAAGRGFTTGKTAQDDEVQVLNPDEDCRSIATLSNGKASRGKTEWVFQAMLFRILLACLKEPIQADRFAPKP